MGFDRTLVFSILLACTLSAPLRAQESHRLWGRVKAVSGEQHEGFIRWDQNEGAWEDVLDGSKEFVPFEYQDWWDLAHPGDRHRDRVIEVAGYRITWDDDEPSFPTTHESGIRLGHVRRLTPMDGQAARLELQSGLEVELSGGASDLGGDLREVLIQNPGGEVVALEWEELEWVEFEPAPPGAEPEGQRLHGTVELREGAAFTGFIAWDGDEILTTDTLTGFGPDGESRDVPFVAISSVRPSEEYSDLTLADGERVRLSGTSDVNRGNNGVQVSDPGLGLVDIDWGDIERVRFHPPVEAGPVAPFDGGRRLRGTVLTADSTELTGWIRWDGDEEYAWELLDGRDRDLGFDVEFGQIDAIERKLAVTVNVTIGARGADVGQSRVEGVRVTLRDGRVLEMDGSNDVNADNDGIFVVEDASGNSPDDEETRWVMVRWEDFRSVHFEWEGER